MNDNIEPIINNFNNLKKQNRILDFWVESNESNTSIDLYVIPHKSVEFINCTISFNDLIKNENHN